MVRNLLPFKGDFSFGKSQKSQGTKSRLSWGWVTWAIWCFAKNCRRRDAWAGALSWWSCQSPAAQSCGLLNHPNSFCGGNYLFNASLTQNLTQIHCSTCSVIWNVMCLKLSTCSLNSIYRPHWPVQWSRHCSYMCIPVHSPCLPGYINVTETFLFILTMAGLFLDRPHLWWICSILWCFLRLVRPELKYFCY